jgi:hypothetical protein
MMLMIDYLSNSCVCSPLIRDEPSQVTYLPDEIRHKTVIPGQQ